MGGTHSRHLRKANPKHFLDYVWPWFQEVLKALHRFRDEDECPGFPLRFAVDFRFVGEHSLGVLQLPFLEALSVAIESLANHDQNEFLDWSATHEYADATPTP